MPEIHLQDTPPGNSFTIYPRRFNWHIPIHRIPDKEIISIVTNLDNYVFRNFCMHLRNNSERKNCKTFPNFYRVTNWRCRSCDVTKKCRLEKLSILSMLRERKGTIVYNSLVTVSNRS